MIKNSELMISHDRLLKGIIAHAEHLNYLFNHKHVVLMPILEGADFYCQVLQHHLTMTFDVDPISVNSYRGTESKELKVSQFPKKDLYGATVIILDDIYDTGKTMKYVKDLCHQRSALSVFSSVLLYKLDVPGQEINTLDFSCFNIQNEFVVGSGLDYDGKYRELEGIWKLPQHAY